MICYLLCSILSEFMFLIHFETELKVLDISDEDESSSVEITDES